MPTDEMSTARVIDVTEPGEEMTGTFASAFGLDLDRADLPAFRERLDRINESERAAGRLAARVQLH
jgi:hypothetical protein